MCVLGAEHPNTLATAGNLALSLSGQGKYADAERIEREVLRVRRRVLGTEHPNTLVTAGNLALSLTNQGKYKEAEEIQREVLGVETRVLGAEHPGTLTTAGNLAGSLSSQGRHAEAEAILRELLGSQKRVLGAEHPDTLMTAANVATTLANQGRHVEAEQMLQAALASCHRVFGSAHPTTLATARNLANMRASMRATLPTKAVPPAAAGTARPLPAGTRVLVQRLVAAREHNGKCARVLSFEARTERYVVSLEDGSELSLKAECLARAGCAAAACASEEASSVCARCHAVRYCSRECQRADWKAHKLVCAVLVAHTKPEPTPAPAPAADSAEPTAESSA
jgi:tetratricopeptide (TPR) repeat protein